MSAPIHRRPVSAIAGIFGLVIAANIFDAGNSAYAEWYSPYPWCAQFGGNRGNSTSCGFYTRQQCLATVSGIGGICYENPSYVSVVEKPRPRRKHRRYRY